MKTKTTFSLLLFALFLSINSFGQQKQVSLSIVLQNGGDLTVVPAPLKYDKDFAFSFTFDDGLISSYQLGYRLFKGGISEVDEKFYPGLYYTDGCGNSIPFTAAISWYTSNDNGVDLHTGSNNAYISYLQARELHDNGWSFFNHSYDHSFNNASINYIDQLENNDITFYNQVGLRLRYVVPPGGDVNYIIPAFNIGAPAAFTSNMGYSNSDGNPVDIDGNVSSGNPVFWRHRITTTDNTPQDSLFGEATARFANAGDSNHLWWNEYTHRVQYDKYGASTKFEHFKSYMESMEAEYGQSGKDNGLFASSIEVFEYLVVRDNIKIHKTTVGSTIIVTLDYTDCPDYLRYNDISLLVNGATISSITMSGKGSFSFAAHKSGYLVNITRPESIYSGVETAEFNTQLFKAFPNPANETISIQAKDYLFNLNSSCKIIDLSGRVLILERPRSTSALLEIDLSQNPIQPGMYIILVEEGDKVLFKDKIIIN